MAERSRHTSASTMSTRQIQKRPCENIGIHIAVAAKPVAVHGAMSDSEASPRRVAGRLPDRIEQVAEEDQAPDRERITGGQQQRGILHRHCAVGGPERTRLRKLRNDRHGDGAQQHEQAHGITPSMAPAR
jgi:hypothetical protein